MGEKFGEEYFEKGTISNYCGYYFGKDFWSILVEDLVEAYHPRRVLDVGCASGSLVECFLNFGIEAYGVDISSYILSKAPDRVRPLLKKVDLNQESIPFPDAHFDLILCLDVLEHISDLDHALREMRRCLSQNGRIFAKIPSSENLGAKNDATHINIFPKDKWENLFAKHELKVKTVHPKSRGKILKKLPLSHLTREIAYALKSGEKNYWFELTESPNR